MFRLIISQTYWTICFLIQKSEHPKGNKPSQNVTEDSVLKTVANGHDAMSAVMSSRSKNLQIVRAMWTSGNTKVIINVIMIKFEILVS